MKGKTMEREQALWCAVIEQAFHDAFMVLPPERFLKGKNAGKKNPKFASERIEQDAARSWLSGASKDFLKACDLAGVDSDYIRDQFLKRAA